MRSLFPALALLLLSSTTTFGQADTTAHELGRENPEDPAAAKKITLNLPSAWTVVERADDDKEPGELAMFKVPGVDGAEDGTFSLYDFGRGGGVKKNIDRWVGMFAEDGRSETVNRGTVVGLSARYFIIELTGTYKSGEGDDVTTQEDYGVTGVVLGVPGKGVFFLELAGPAKTVVEQSKALRPSFGADEEEFPVKLEDL